MPRKGKPKPKTRKTPMKSITFHIPITWLNKLQELVENGLYPNISEAIRVAIRDFILKEKRMRKALDRYLNDDFIS